MLQSWGYSNFRFEKLDIADRKGMADLFAVHRFPHVVHLAGQAGVRHSLIDPHAYADANLTGFLNVLEGCRHADCRHLVYASSSSVYGANTRVPFRASDNVDHPLSLYGATKKANELMAHAYAHLFALPATGLRFFTVYGPWGRPDMAMWLFTEAIMHGRPIRLFNHGRMRRDFTYIDDVVEAVVRLVPPQPPSPNPAWSGNAPDPAQPRSLACLQHRQQPPGRGDRRRALDRGGDSVTARIRELLPMQPGDVPETYADVARSRSAVGFAPRTPIEEGIRRFVDWFLQVTPKMIPNGVAACASVTL